MDFKDKKIFLTYELGGKSLKQRGVYTSANVAFGANKTKYDCGVEDKETIITKPSFQVKAPVYHKVTQFVTLGESFLEMVFTKPECPFKHRTDEFYSWLRSPMGTYFKKFKTMSDTEKLDYHLNWYVNDMGGISYTYSFV